MVMMMMMITKFEGKRAEKVFWSNIFRKFSKSHFLPFFSKVACGAENFSTKLGLYKIFGDLGTTALENFLRTPLTGTGGIVR